MLSLLTTLAAAQTFDAPSRWHLTSEVDLPAVMWMAADRNTEARMVGWKLELVLDCPAAEKLKRGAEVVCGIADASVSAAAHPSDKGMMGVILSESEQRLEAADLTLRVNADGALKAVSLSGLPTMRRRQTAMNENLRLMVSRAVAGFDQPVPKRDVEAGWFQRGGWIAMLPASAGTLAGGKVVHERTGEADGVWTVATEGRVTLEPFSQNQWPAVGQPAVARIEGPLHPMSWDGWEGAIGMVAWFQTELRATGRVEAGSGALLERSWSASGEPSPSSRVSLGAKGYPYVQHGTLRRLDGEEAPSLAESAEYEPDTDTPSAIQTWETLGALW